MPKVPMDDPQFSLNVPGVNAPQTREFAKVGEATEQLGNTIESGSLDTLIAMKQAEAADASSSAYYSDKLASEQQMTNLKLVSPDGYMHEDNTDPTSPIVKNQDGSSRTITDEFHDWANDRFKNAQTQMPTTLAAQMYRNRALPFFSDQTGLLQNDAQVMKVKAYDQRRDMQVRALGDQLADNPDINTFYSHYNDVALDGQQQIGVMHNETDNEMKTAAYGKSLSRDYMKGVYTNLLDEKRVGQDPTTLSQDIDKALNEVRGNDPRSYVRQVNGLPTLSSLMDPIQKAVEEDKLERLRPLARGVDEENYKHAFTNTIAGQKQGSSTDDAFNAMASATVQYGLAKPGNEVDAADRMGQLYGARELGRLNDPAVQIMSRSDQNALYDQAETRAKQKATEAGAVLGLKGPYAEDLGAITTGAIESQRLEQQKQIDGEKSKDLAAFAQAPVNEFGGKSRLTTGNKVNLLDFTNLPSLSQGSAPQDYSRWSYEYNTYAKHEWSDQPENYRAPITKTQGQVIADQLSNPLKLNETQAGQGVTALTKFWGKDFGQNVDQMVKDGSLGDQYRIMGLHANDKSSDSMTNLMFALRGSPATEKAWNENIKNESITSSTLNDAVANATKQWTASQVQGNPLSVASLNTTNAINGSVKTMTQALMLGNQNLATDPNLAAKKAYNMLIGNFVHTSTMGGGWFTPGPKIQSTSATPNEVNMGGYTRSISDDDMKTIDANINNMVNSTNVMKFNPVVPLRADGKPSYFATEFGGIVSGSAAKSYTNSPEPGYNIHYTDSTNQNRTLMTKNNRGATVPVFIPLSQAIRPVPNNPTFLQKLEQYWPWHEGQSGGNRTPQSVASETFSSEDTSEGNSVVDTGANTKNSPTNTYAMSSNLVLPPGAEDQTNSPGTTKNIQYQDKFDKNGKRSINFTHD